MDIVSIASFLVYPGKGQETPQPSRGVMISLEGGLYEMINALFIKSDRECNNPIRFIPEEDGTQNNDVRNQMIDFIKTPSLETGIVLANRLRDFSTNVSKLGLLFLILGREGSKNKIVLSRSC